MKFLGITQQTILQYQNNNWKYQNFAYLPVDQLSGTIS